MRQRFAPLVPFALTLVLAACANQPSQPQIDTNPAQASLPARPVVPTPAMQGAELIEEDELTLAEFADHAPYELPQLADSILEKGMSLIGTRYRFGGTSQASGFDCSGFIGFLFREELGMDLPRSTREMIKIDAPLVERKALERGDLVFFSTNGRGRVSHAGIYLGDDQFIHSSSSRSGGVRIDSLDDAYWKRTFIEAKRVLALAPTEHLAPQR